ncbi:hypothetical protein COCCADRAFT_25180 [Bipolaris zeicola 26-R-13]|uniref:Uncharacterized protein n=1 Tax=Cochliobolus carbonum (strain 26-R-13) TaxID=930089 RepID=W6YB41_COCC2|nr:uncharacterized protein COCCADRAFT_25180 [Bipolaris zeicola 26-R-13]EUC34720.1 hypothetical protein COCCADRAFT_25180 [Bipolaris zeicola 26-R-13]
MRYHIGSLPDNADREAPIVSLQTVAPIETFLASCPRRLSTTSDIHLTILWRLRSATLTGSARDMSAFSPPRAPHAVAGPKVREDAYQLCFMSEGFSLDTDKKAIQP